MDLYRISKINLVNAKVKNPYYVYKLEYVSAKGIPRYKLKKQCPSEESAREYIKKLDVSASTKHS